MLKNFHGQNQTVRLVLCLEFIYGLQGNGDLGIVVLCSCDEAFFDVTGMQLSLRKHGVQSLGAKTFAATNLEHSPRICTTREFFNRAKKSPEEKPCEEISACVFGAEIECRTWSHGVRSRVPNTRGDIKRPFPRREAPRVPSSFQEPAGLALA